MRGDTDASCYPRSRTPTKSSEDYLEAILVIRRLRGSYRNVNIAERDEGALEPRRGQPRPDVRPRRPPHRGGRACRVGNARAPPLLRAAARRVRRGRRDRLGGGLTHGALPVRGLLQTFRGLSREPTRRGRWRVNGGRLSGQTVRLAQFQPTMCLSAETRRLLDSFEEPCEFLSDFGIMRFAGADVLKCRHRSPSEPLETV